MIAVILVVCHFTHPVECAWPKVAVSPTPIGCLVEAQQRAQDWLEDHPGWTLVRPVCEPDELAKEKP